MRVNLVGGAFSSAHLAPTDSPSWVCGEHYEKYKHLNVSRIYEIHKRVFREGYIEVLLDSGVDVVMAEGTPYKGAKEFDFERSKDLIGRTYLTSTMSYMMSDAIADGYDEIYLYGITLSADSEYFSQRPCMEWWAGFAEGHGIKIEVPENCPLSKSDKIYGLDCEPHPFSEGSINELINGHKTKANQLQDKIEELRMMEIAQAANIDLLEKLAVISRRHGDGEVIKKLTDMIRVR